MDLSAFLIFAVVQYKLATGNWQQSGSYSLTYYLHINFVALQLDAYMKYLAMLHSIYYTHAGAVDNGRTLVNKILISYNKDRFIRVYHY